MVAAATRTRFFLAEVLEERPADDPERFVCAYAGDMLAGVLPGPYSDESARCGSSRAPEVRAAA